MKFKRLAILLLSLVAISNIVRTRALAGGGSDFEEFSVQTLMGSTVSVKVDRHMFKGDKFTTDTGTYTEQQWINSFIRNLLIGKNAETVTKVVLRPSVPKKGHRRWVSCPPVLASEGRFFAKVSPSGTDLTIVSPDISSTFYDKWFLNEAGLTLFG